MDLVLEDKNKDAGVVIVIESGQKQPKDNYMNNSVKALSILHIVLGILSCSVCFYELFYISYHPYGSRLISTIGEGIFFGIPFLVTGILGLISLKNTSYGKITAFLVFSILSAIFGVLLFVLAFYLRFFSLNWHRSTTTISVCQSLLMFIGFLEDG